MTAPNLIPVTAGRSQVGVVPTGTPAPPGVHRLQLLLIKPSKYDDDGFVHRYFRGVLPSNTLATIAGLSRDVEARGLLGAGVTLDILMLDEHVQRVDPRKLARRYRGAGTRTLVALCGVQTNQFPRATDLALEFHELGLQVMVGGFHVSGAIAMSHTGIPPECQALMDRGVTLVKGEIEECWDALLRDALHGRLRPYYDIVDAPSLDEAALPVVDEKLMRRFAYPSMGTIDAGRGCPFNCHFCTIINVQGRKMRCRPAARIKDQIRANRGREIDYYFFTDDNFSRNPNWEEIFDALIELRCQEGIEVTFMMQVDVPSWRLPGFVDKAAAAGCTQVFIGMETLNPANIPASGKRQNKVTDYKTMIDTWHAKGIACHVGYIIGFPEDTVESVRRDVHDLRETIGVDQASFFMLTPLPGSQDHADMSKRGEWMDDDYNRFDSFHATTRHPKMTAEQWWEAYRGAWRDFYSVEGMKSILGRARDEWYWDILKNFVWYRYSAIIEETHPMICGFYRIKDRRQRRPGFPVESPWTHSLRRVRDLRRWLREVTRLYFEIQEVWLATRGRAQIHEGVEKLKRRYEELTERISSERASLTRRASRAILHRLDPVGVRVRSRAHLDAFWQETRSKLRRGRILRINPLRMVINLARDVRICTRFNLELLASGTAERATSRG